MAIRSSRSSTVITPDNGSMFGGWMRENQARRLYDLGFGDVLGCASFYRYLSGTDAVEPVPEIPAFSRAQYMVFGDQRENMFLVDERVPKKIGWNEYCKRLGLVSKIRDEEVVHRGSEHVVGCSGIRWMIGQAGARHQGLSVPQARQRFESIGAAGAFDEVGMNAIEGATVFAMAPEIIKQHIFHLPSSARRDFSVSCACLGIFRDGPEIGWWWRGHAGSDIAVATRGDKDAPPRYYEPSPLDGDEELDDWRLLQARIPHERYPALEKLRANPQYRLEGLRLRHCERLQRR